MIAQLKYGSGIPFYRLEQLEGQLGIPLPVATQWEIVAEAAELLKPACNELIRHVAQGEVVHNDNTSMRVLRLAHEPSDERTGVFTTGVVSTGAGWKIALYFTGHQHAGENIADVLQQPAAELRETTNGRASSGFSITTTQLSSCTRPLWNQFAQRAHFSWLDPGVFDPRSPFLMR